VNSDQQVKIKWFKLRTGSSEKEALKWLSENKWKIDNSIDAMKLSWKENNERTNQKN